MLNGKTVARYSVCKEAFCSRRPCEGAAQRRHEIVTSRRDHGTMKSLSSRRRQRQTTTDRPPYVRQPSSILMVITFCYAAGERKARISSRAGSRSISLAFSCCSCPTVLTSHRAADRTDRSLASHGQLLASHAASSVTRPGLSTSKDRTTQVDAVRES